MAVPARLFKGEDYESQFSHCTGHDAIYGSLRR